MIRNRGSSLGDRAVHVTPAVERPVAHSFGGIRCSSRESFCRLLAPGTPPPEEKQAERVVAAARSLLRSSLAAAVPRHKSHLLQLSLLTPGPGEANPLALLCVAWTAHQPATVYGSGSCSFSYNSYFLACLFS
jgi:hypothetical protein